MIHYEWHRRWRGRKRALRLGLILTVTDAPLTEMQAYATTAEVIENPSLGAPRLSPRLLNLLAQEVLGIVEEALKRLTAAAQTPRHAVFYIRVPQTLSVAPGVQTSDGHIRVLPSTIFKRAIHETISAVVVTVPAASETRARERAMPDALLLCALLTLANVGAAPRDTYRVVDPPWTFRRRPVFTVESLEAATLDRLYTLPQQPVLPGNIDAQFAARLAYVWGAYHQLDEHEQTQFLQALLAFYSGKELSNEQPTLASVAYAAALNALARDREEKCLGDLTCSVHDSLGNFRHNNVGSAAALRSLVSDLLDLNDTDEIRYLKQLLNRVYGDQRSAYVHGAVLRHSEAGGRGAQFPASAPEGGEPVGALYGYRADFYALESLAGPILLTWLARRAGVPVLEGLAGLARKQLRQGVGAEYIVHADTNIMFMGVDSNPSGATAS